MSAAGSHKNQDGAVALLVAFGAVLCFSLPLFNYLDCESIGLRAHGLWRTKVIPWKDVTHVGPVKPKLPKFIVIEYAREASLTGRGHIGFAPKKREVFVAALRQFAPHAEFEV
jgi:hypothetical protein